MHRGSKIVLIVLLSIGWCNAGAAGTAAFGSLRATQDCEAYLSKNKRSNPDRARLVPGRMYPVFEVNKPEDPNWYRVRVDSAQPPERWVSEGCGTVEVSLRGAEEGGDEQRRDACSTAGLEDGYILALSWHPAFCESHGAKPECRIDNPKSYQARNFTLHGLWPNKVSCGIHYEFCGKLGKKQNDFCNYPELSLTTGVRAELEQVMPSAAAGSCLQRHEWFKHGTCQNDWPLDRYYETAVDLTRQFNESGIAYFLSRHIGAIVTEKALIDRVDCAHGPGAHNGLELKCKNGNLVDVYVRLPGTIDTKSGIGELMRRAAGEFKSNCGGRFKVDRIGF